MKQIYTFESQQPPVLTERMLISEIERREIRWQTAMLTFAGVLLIAAMLLAATLLMPVQPVLGGACIAYSVFSVIGGGALIIVFRQKRGIFI